MSITYTGPHKKGDIKKVVLAYSGGLDTSVILKWLQTAYGCEVVTFTADLGQGEELSPARKKAEMLGIKPENIVIDDVREEFVRDFVFPMFRANALYEGQYLLGTSIARPLIAKGNDVRTVKLRADDGAPLAWLHGRGTVAHQIVDGETVSVDVSLSRQLWGQFEKQFAQEEA